MPGRDKFYKIINNNGLMLKPQRRRHTTNSNHNYHKYKDLAKTLVVDGPNRLWVADITFTKNQRYWQLLLISITFRQRVKKRKQ